jgi:hypothetical protein
MASVLPPVPRPGSNDSSVLAELIARETKTEFPISISQLQEPVKEKEYYRHEMATFNRLIGNYDNVRPIPDLTSGPCSRWMPLIQTTDRFSGGWARLMCRQVRRPGARVGCTGPREAHPMLAFNLFGDGPRDALAPKSSR